MTQSNILITGSSTGIGRACALRMAQKGHRVFAAVRRPEDGEALRRQAPEHIVPLCLDVTREEEIEAIRRTLEQELGAGGLQGLVNNAGIAVGGPLETVRPEDLRRQFEVNLFGQVRVTQALLQLLRRAKGRLVFMSSISGRMASPYVGPYSASKYALEAVGDAWRRELRADGIAVSLIEPGAIRTPIWDKAVEGAGRYLEGLSAAMIERYGRVLESMEPRLRRTAERSVSPERVADAVEHALTARRPRTRYLVGTDAHIGAFLAWLLPDRILDPLMRRMS